MKKRDTAGDSAQVNRSRGAVCDEEGAPARPDTLSRAGAMALAKQLEEYWRMQGYPSARFWAEPIGERFAKVGTYELYRVACNLVKGRPPRFQE